MGRAPFAHIAHITPWRIKNFFIGKAAKNYKESANVCDVCNRECRQTGFSQNVCGLPYMNGDHIFFVVKNSPLLQVVIF